MMDVTPGPTFYYDLLQRLAHRLGVAYNGSHV